MFKGQNNLLVLEFTDNNNLDEYEAHRNVVFASKIGALNLKDKNDSQLVENQVTKRIGYNCILSKETLKPLVLRKVIPMLLKSLRPLGG